MTRKRDDIKYHEVLKEAAIYSYSHKNSIPNGYILREPINIGRDGFYADVLQQGNDIIIAYRGTNNLFNKDLRNDIAMARAHMPEQAYRALEVYDRIKRENPNSDISVTGHSLGGSLAEVVGGLRGAFAVTFNAYGTKDMFKDSSGLKTGNVINYVNEKDRITMANAENHIGTTYTVAGGDGNQHNAETIGPLSGRVEKSPQELQAIKARLHPNLIKAQQGVQEIASVKDYAIDTGKKAVNAIGSIPRKIVNKTVDIAKGANRELNRGVQEIKHSASNCVGSYSVSGYKRSDGTEVAGYTRHCGAGHNR